MSEHAGYLFIAHSFRLFEERKYNFRALLISRYGLECLFRFYSYGLEKHFRSHLFKDFQIETLRDMEHNQLYGLEKFWAFMKYYKKAKKLNVDAKIQHILEKYKTIEDFRVEMVSISICKLLFSFS